MASVGGKKKALSADSGFTFIKTLPLVLKNAEGTIVVIVPEEPLSGYYGSRTFMMTISDKTGREFSFSVDAKLDLSNAEQPIRSGTNIKRSGVLQAKGQIFKGTEYGEAMKIYEHVVPQIRVAMEAKNVSLPAPGSALGRVMANYYSAPRSGGRD